MVKYISSKLREARKKCGLSQKELADRVYSTQAMISMYESGKVTPKGDMRKALSKALGYSVEDLFFNNVPDIETLNVYGKKLSEWLKKNYDPYAAIVITDEEVKLIRTEYGAPTNSLDATVRMPFVKDGQS